MFSILQVNQFVKGNGMSDTRKTLSTAEVQEEWLEIQAAQSDPARFRPLYERYYEPIFRFIYRRCSDSDLAADLCSQVFLKALQRLGDYQFRGVPFSSWLFRIASNEIAQHYRSLKGQRTVSLESTQLGDMAEEMELDTAAPVQEDLVRALDELREEDLLLIELRYFEQLPFKEIAEILDITESNAKVKTYRILEKMKRFLSNNL